MFDIEDIEKSILEFRELIDNYEEVHIRLTCELEDDYMTDYPNYDRTYQRLTGWIKQAKGDIKGRNVEICKAEDSREESRLREVRHMEEEKARAEEAEAGRIAEVSRLEEEKKVCALREQLKVEVKYFTERMYDEIRNIREKGSTLPDELEKHLCVVRHLKTAHSELFTRVENAFGLDFQGNFGESFCSQRDYLNDVIRSLMEDITQKKLEKVKIDERASRLQSLREEEKHAWDVEKRVAKFHGIFENIRERGLLFEQNCDVNVIAQLDDSQIIQRVKNKGSLDLAYNEILDWITQLIEASPPEYERSQEMVEMACNARVNIKNWKDAYSHHLDQEFSLRDLSSTKIADSAALDIKVPKFSGYDSKLDFYTFKSEFERLIAPRVRAPILPDHLKLNYLTGPALEVVKEIKDLESIWERLQSSFGNVQILLTNKLCAVTKDGQLGKLKDEKLVNGLMKLINGIKELGILATQHGIEGILYHPSNTAKIYEVMGRQKQIKFLERTADKSMTDKEEWGEILKFLEKEHKIREKLSLVDRSKSDSDPKNVPDPKNASGQKSNTSQSLVTAGITVTCAFCGKTDHVSTVTKSNKHVVHYFACPKFAELGCKKRLTELQNKNLCFQCLNPGLKKDHPGNCYDNFCCPHDEHKGHDRRYHILVCDKHKNDPANLALLTEYRSRFIEKPNRPYEVFSKNIAIFHAGSNPVACPTEIENIMKGRDVAIFMQQTIVVKGIKINLFYDSGCSDMVCKKTIVALLEKMGLAKQVGGPRSLIGVADKKTFCKYGTYTITLPLHDGNNVELTGLCLDKITSEFPTYDLSEAERDIHTEFDIHGKSTCSCGKGVSELPKLPDSVGGETDIMIGIEFFRYFPEQLFKLKNGLTIFESHFTSADGTRGVVGGPHSSFTELHKKMNWNHHNVSAYLTDEVREYRDYCRLSKEVSLLGGPTTQFDSESLFETPCPSPKCTSTSDNDYPGDSLPRKRENFDHENRVPIFSYPSYGFKSLGHVGRKQLKRLKMFEEAEAAGTEISYRCVRCRGCPDCKCGARIDCISIEEEVEQTVINNSVHVIPEEKRIVCKLPFLCDPVSKLPSSNKTEARKIYDGQLKQLGKRDPEDKQDGILSERTLQDLGYVDYLDNLTPEQQKKILSSKVKYFIPWRLVWNPNSNTTKCRLVYDASHPTSTGFSLNSLLAKGKNNMNKLIDLAIRWGVREHGFHTDVRKMYNSIALDEDHWCYQLYLWQEKLDVAQEPRIKVVKTAIYGVTSSGNQAERGLRETGKLMADEYPRVNEVIQRDIYVDDCVSGEESHVACCETVDGLQTVLSTTGLSTKGTTMSGSHPPEGLSNPDNSINVLGSLWYPLIDILKLKIGELNFGKKVRGKKSAALAGKIPETFSRSDCAARVAEVFDLLGKCAPIIGGFKMDLRELAIRKVDWDDVIPDELKSTWLENFELIKELGDVTFRRCIVPEDAVNLDIETIEIGDASQQLVCSAVYVRFKRKSGNYSCQLCFAKTKIVPPDMTLPRAELFAAVLTASIGHVVFTSLNKFIKKRIHLTDSQIALFQISNVKIPQKQWVRYRTIEVNRLTDSSRWAFIDSENNMADIGTRKGAKVKDISEGSVWMNGYEWASLPESEFPIKFVHEINLSAQDRKLCEAEKLIINNDWINRELGIGAASHASISEANLVSIKNRLEFSKYIVEPNRFRLRKVIRIVSLVFLFIKNLKWRTFSAPVHVSNLSVPSQFKSTEFDRCLSTCDGGQFPFSCEKRLVVTIDDSVLGYSLDYFFKKATLEIKHFLAEKQYKTISYERNGVLLYTGRILPTQKVDGGTNLADVCVDLSGSTFCVPLVDKSSPLAYALINEVHWYDKDACHRGNETVMRHVQLIAHIIEGKPLVKQFRLDCAKCRILNKRAIEVAMGPVSNHNLIIAPAFFVSQVDICGPFLSYFNINKRATVKVWFNIFCCTTTGAVDIKIMEDYSTTSFILAFIRFSCKVGFPQKLLPDAGSQLIKGCNSMTISYTDLKNQLHKEYGVKFEACPVGAHYQHGKVERKIRHVRESLSKTLSNDRLSLIQWETIGCQIANSINNQPIALGNETKGLEHLDILTPNRLILARNNNRCPVGALEVTNDPGRIIGSNVKLYQTWFKCWLISCVPKLMDHPKWFESSRDSKIGDVILFLKSDKEFDRQYQYGIISDMKVSRDGKIREIEVEYQNSNENVKRTTRRGVREVVLVHPVEELGIIRQIGQLSTNFV